MQVAVFAARAGQNHDCRVGIITETVYNGRGVFTPRGFIHVPDNIAFTKVFRVAFRSFARAARIKIPERIVYFESAALERFFKVYASYFCAVLRSRNRITGAGTRFGNICRPSAEEAYLFVPLHRQRVVFVPEKHRAFAFGFLYHLFVLFEQVLAVEVFAVVGSEEGCRFCVRVIDGDIVTRAENLVDCRVTETNSKTRADDEYRGKRREYARQNNP